MFPLLPFTRQALQTHWSSAKIAVVCFLVLSFPYGRPKIEHSISVWLNVSWTDKVSPSLIDWLCSCSYSPGYSWLLYLARTHCWLMLSLLSTQTPETCSSQLLSSLAVPSLCHCKGLFNPRLVLYIWSCWIFLGSCWPIDPACLDLSRWQPRPLTYWLETSTLLSCSYITTISLIFELSFLVLFFKIFLGKTT